jgi:hypothetical protein
MATPFIYEAVFEKYPRLTLVQYNISLFQYYQICNVLVVHKAIVTVLIPIISGARCSVVG